MSTAPLILVIDDDEAMQVFCLKALTAAGYRTWVTGDALEALAVIEQEPVDLFIVDVLLSQPTLQLRSRLVGSRFDNGMAVVQAALMTQPNLSVLFISAHSRMTLLSKGVDPDRWPVLRKPFGAAVLRTEVAVRLEAAKAQQAGMRVPRLHPRYAVQCLVQFTGDQEGDGQILNLSLGGCLLQTAVPLDPDSHLSLRLDLPQEPEPMLVHVAVTRWGRGGVYGLSFLLLEEQSERRLAAFLARMKPLA
ncbi:PilZ domain-containing protein [Candidatus Nitrospira bockiana]